MIDWFINFLRGTPPVSHYTVDTGVLAPYPDMSQDDLDDYEEWARQIDK